MASGWYGHLKNNCRTGDAAQRGLSTEKGDGEVTIRDNSRDAKESTLSFDVADHARRCIG